MNEVEKSIFDAKVREGVRHIIEVSDGPRVLITMMSGSRLFGCAVDESDVDVKFIFQPSREDILTEELHDHFKGSTMIDWGCGPRKLEVEGFSLKKYLDMLATGQTIAVEMLFVPRDFYIEARPDLGGDVVVSYDSVGKKHYYDGVWAKIIRNRDKFVSTRVQSFVGYCRKQFSKYCMKSHRYEAVTELLSILTALPQKDRLIEHLPALQDFCGRRPEEAHLTGTDLSVNPNYTISLCKREAQLNCKVADAVLIYTRLSSMYGDRVKSMADCEVEWKALYHAVRVAYEAIEYMETGKITLPRPEKDFLLKIRNNEVNYQEIVVMLEDMVIKVENMASTSSMPKYPDEDLMKKILVEQNFMAVHDNPMIIVCSTIHTLEP